MNTSKDKHIYFKGGCFMNRKEKIEFCNNNIFNQVDIRVADSMDRLEVLKMVSDWRKGKPIDIKMTARVDDGFLFINEEPVGRIASKLPRDHYFSEQGYYIEQKILARQEFIWNW